MFRKVRVSNLWSPHFTTTLYALPKTFCGPGIIGWSFPKYSFYSSSSQRGGCVKKWKHTHTPIIWYGLHFIPHFLRTLLIKTRDDGGKILSLFLVKRLLSFSHDKLPLESCVLLVLDIRRTVSILDLVWLTQGKICEVSNINLELRKP